MSPVLPRLSIAPYIQSTADPKAVPTIQPGLSGWSVSVIDGRKVIVT